MTVCGLVDLPVVFAANIGACVPEYTPVSKSVMSVCKEVAGWSGASCHLDRDGTLRIYDWQEAYCRGGLCPRPSTVTATEEHDALYPTLECTVVGHGRGRRWVPPRPGHFRPPGADPNIPAYVPPQPGYWDYVTAIQAVESTSTLVGALGEQVVEERIEISEYEIFPELAERLAAGVTTRAALQAGAITYSGPAEGCQGYRPIDYRIFSVQRSLDWNGAAYRYLIDITGPTAIVDPPSSGPRGKDWW